MTNDNDIRLLRLLDLKEFEHIIVGCRCGRIVEFMPGYLQRRHRLPSTTLVYDLQYILRCTRCNAIHGFEIVIQDMRNRGNSSKPCPKRVIVART